MEGGRGNGRGGAILQSRAGQPRCVAPLRWGSAIGPLALRNSPRRGGRPAPSRALGEGQRFEHPLGRARHTPPRELEGKRGRRIDRPLQEGEGPTATPPPGSLRRGSGGDPPPPGAWAEWGMLSHVPAGVLLHVRASLLLHVATTSCHMFLRACFYMSKRASCHMSPRRAVTCSRGRAVTCPCGRALTCRRDVLSHVPAGVHSLGLLIFLNLRRLLNLRSLPRLRR